MSRYRFCFAIFALLAGLAPATAAEWLCVQKHLVQVIASQNQPQQRECKFVERIRSFSFKLPGAIDAFSASTRGDIPTPLGSTIRIGAGSRLAILGRSDGSWDQNRLAYSMESASFFFIRGDVSLYGLPSDNFKKTALKSTYVSLVEIPGASLGQPAVIEVGQVGVGGPLRRNPQTKGAVRSFSVTSGNDNLVNEYMLPAEFLAPLIPFRKPAHSELPLIRSTGSTAVKRCGAKLEVSNTDFLKDSLALSLDLGMGAISGTSEQTLERSFERVVRSEFDAELLINLTAFAVPRVITTYSMFDSRNNIEFDFIYMYEYQYDCIEQTKYRSDFYIIDGKSSRETRISIHTNTRSEAISGDVEFFEVERRLQDIDLEKNVARFIVEHMTTLR
jgi:hypothetical protein